MFIYLGKFRSESGSRSALFCMVHGAVASCGGAVEMGWQQWMGYCRSSKGNRPSSSFSFSFYFLLPSPPSHLFNSLQICYRMSFCQWYTVCRFPPLSLNENKQQNRQTNKQTDMRLKLICRWVVGNQQLGISDDRRYSLFLLLLVFIAYYLFSYH